MRRHDTLLGLLPMCIALFCTAIPGVVRAQASNDRTPAIPTCPGDFSHIATNIEEIASFLDARNFTAKPLPKIAALVRDTAKIYACRRLVNYYAELNGLPDHLTGAPKKKAIGNHLIYSFGTDASPKLCGTLSIEVNTGVGLSDDIVEVYKDTERRNNEVFFSLFEPAIAYRARRIADAFIPTFTGRVPPPAEPLLAELSLLNATILHSHFVTLQRTQPWGPPAPELPPDRLSSLGFLKNSDCSVPLPTATPPDHQDLRQDPDAAADFARLVEWLDRVISNPIPATSK